MLRIKEILKEKGSSQVELAFKLGLSTIGLNKMINGNPTVETLLKIASALDVDVKDLFISTKEAEALEPIYMKQGDNLVQVGNIDSKKVIVL